MTTAQAVFIRGAGGPEMLELGDLEVRDPGGGELLVAVAAAGLNRADTLQRRGYYPAPSGVEPDVPGLEYAGTVAAVGVGVQRFSVGDRVMGISAGAAMATHLVVHQREAIPVPAGMSLEDAAAIPEAFLTAWDAIVSAGTRPGDTLLVHAIGSGVGTAALQLANAMGVHVIGTSRTESKLSRCAALGSFTPLHVTEGTFSKRVGGRANVILDTVGAAYLTDNIKSLAPQGTIITIGLLGGASGQLPLALLLAKRARIIGSVLRSRPLEEKAALAQDFERRALPWFEDKTIRPVVDDVLPMTEVANAHTRMERNQTFGKLVLAWR